MLELPPDIAEACKPLFESLPFEQAMPHLQGSHPRLTELVQSVVEQPVIAANPQLVAGLWLYVDDLERNHEVCQDLPDPTGAYWHAIMHRREGDFPNSRYWFNRAARHALLTAGASDLVGEVSSDKGANSHTLLEKQREEWAALFSLVCEQSLRESHREQIK